MRNGLSSHRKRGGSQSSREQQYRQPNRKGAGIRIKGNFVITTRKGVFRQVRERRTRTFIPLIVGVVRCFRTKGASGVGLFEAIKGPEFREYVGTDPVGFVVSLNLHRRHLNESQRGMVATNIATLGRGRPQKSSTENGPIGPFIPPSIAEAAELMNVGTSTVKRSKKVKDQAIPELYQAAQTGSVAVSTAAIVSELPKPEQAEIVAKGEKAILEAAKTFRVYKKGRGGGGTAGYQALTRVITYVKPLSGYSTVFEKW